MGAGSVLRIMVRLERFSLYPPGHASRAQLEVKEFRQQTLTLLAIARWRLRMKSTFLFAKLRPTAES